MDNKVTTYNEAERLYSDGLLRKGIDGTRFNKTKSVGYCLFCEHEGFLTEKDVRSHNCKGKNCPHFLPKVSVSKGKTKLKVTSTDIVPILNAAIKDFEGIIVIRAEKNFKGSFDAFYAAISTYDEGEIEEIILKKTGLEVKLKKLSYSFENAAKIIFKNK